MLTLIPTPERRVIKLKRARIIADRTRQAIVSAAYLDGFERERAAFARTGGTTWDERMIEAHVDLAERCTKAALHSLARLHAQVERVIAQRGPVASRGSEAG